MKAIDPASGETIRDIPEHAWEEVVYRLAGAARAFPDWAAKSFAERAVPIRQAARLLREEAGDLALLMAEEMGKPVREGKKEAEKCAWVCDHYAEHAERYLADEPAPSDASRSFVAFEPLGCVLAVMPWNFPFWQVFRFAAPALMAGNVGVLKHASNVPGCALLIEDLLRRAGVPEGVFSTLLIGSSVIDRVIAHPHVAAVTLTGSTPAGRSVGRAAGEALKKSVLELGGSDPYLVLEDADLAVAAETCAQARLVNSGQSCIAGKRFVVVRSVLEPFQKAFVDRMRRAKMGNPRDEDTDVGPQARVDLRDDLHRQVKRSVERGARILLGGEVPERAGAWYPPTVLTDVAAGMPAYDEETFGPVAAVIPVADEAEAIRVANDTPFGLGAAVFTKDAARAERVARALRAGACFVNGLVKSDPRLPFGGIKESGYGRELGIWGIREFVNVKTIWMR
jgi:succinate-semialdehyde dehydrogenase/glutarate-semialdehyde dehydrogenase